jgi:hypothetical protein
MQDPAQVLVGDEPRQLALQRTLDLAPSLAQFRLDEGKSESVVDVLFARCDQAARLVQAVRFELHALLGR